MKKIYSGNKAVLFQVIVHVQIFDVGFIDSRVAYPKFVPEMVSFHG